MLFYSNPSISQTWFNRAQVVFLVWNALNDPIFGYLQVYFISLSSSYILINP